MAASAGPRIVLFGPMEVDLAALQQCFHGLSQGSEPIELNKQEFVVPFGGVQVRARVARAGSWLQTFGDERGVVQRTATPLQFDWTQSAEDWGAIADLVGGLLESTVATHQYLTMYSAGDAVVVASKGEYPDDVLARL